MRRCASLDIAEEAIPTRDAFTATFDVLESSAVQWAELMRCRECGQFWKVDADLDRLASHAFKLPSAVGWLDFNERPTRAALLVRLLGGTSSERCMQAGCRAAALAARAFCIRHLDTGYKL